MSNPYLDYTRATEAHPTVIVQPKRKVYIAGPMRGYEQWNFPRFLEAKQRWQEAGWHVFCPATMATAMGYGPDTPAEPGDGQAAFAHLRHVIGSDIDCIMNANALAVLTGWETSRGATVEVAVAQFLGLPIYCAHRMCELDLVLAPWSLYYDRYGPKPKHPPCKDG